MNGVNELRMRMEVLQWIEQAERDWLLIDRKYWGDMQRLPIETTRRRETDNELEQLCKYGHNQNVMDHYSNSLRARTRNMTLNNEDREYDFVMMSVMQNEIIKRMSHARTQPLQEQRDSVQPELTKGKNTGV